MAIPTASRIKKASCKGSQKTIIFQTLASMWTTVFQAVTSKDPHFSRWSQTWKTGRLGSSWPKISAALVETSFTPRHGHVFTWDGVMNLNNKKYEKDSLPIDEKCGCPVCQRYSRAYLRHLLKSGEVLFMRFAAMHNLYFYNSLMAKIRQALDDGTFTQFRNEYSQILDRRI